MLDVDALTVEEASVLRTAVTIYSKLVGWASDDHPGELSTVGTLVALSTCISLLDELGPD